MKIIHVADLHLDSKMNANLDKEKSKERKAEILHTFSRLVDYAVDNDVMHILIAGDMFDRKTITAGTRNTVYEIIKANPQICFYYLKGNHDMDGFLSSIQEIPSNLLTFGSEWKSYALDKENSVTLTAIELDKDNSQIAYSALVLNDSDINIVMMHGQETENGSTDKAEIINLRALKNKSIDYLALGHVHSYKEGELDGRGAWCYPGCLDPRGFDETGEHGFVLLDVDVLSRKVAREFVKFSSRELTERHIDVSGGETSTYAIEKIDDELMKNPISSRNLVKFVLEGTVSIDALFDTEYISKHYEEDYYFTKVYDRTTLSVDYRDYLLDESLKGEYVRLVMNDESLSDDDKAHIIKCGLTALEGGEVTL